jgi:hypothetical protein
MLFASLAVAGSFGCARHTDASRSKPDRGVAAGGVETSATAARTFDRPDLGVRLDVPAGWAEWPSKDFALLLIRASDAKNAADESRDPPSISLEVPKLPLHIPGMIPIGSVRGGYVDDLRKAVGKLQTADLKPPNIPAAAVRLVRSTWTDSGGQPKQETALLLVHADRVYILRGRSLTSDEQATRGAYDGMVRSLRWTKK